MNNILVIGHLNVDYLIPGEWFVSGELMDKPKASVGGTGYNAAKAFKSVGIDPVIIGCVGNDKEGRLIKKRLERDKIGINLIRTTNQPTGTCHIINVRKSGRDRRFFIRNKGDANIYDRHAIEKALESREAKKCDCCFIAGHLLEIKQENEAAQIIQVIGRGKRNILLDLVPHTLYEYLNADSLNRMISNTQTSLITEYKTIVKMIDENNNKEEPDEEDWSRLFSMINATSIVLRYGEGEISKQQIRAKNDKHEIVILQEIETRYMKLKGSEKVQGFGDEVTAKMLVEHYDDLFYNDVRR